MSQSSLNWEILSTVQGQQCHIVLPKIVQNCPTWPDKDAQNCSKWPKLARKNCSKLLKKLLKIAENCSNLLKIAQKLHKFAQVCSKLLKIARNVSKCLTMGQQVSKGVMFLHIQVRKLSLLGIAVAGVYCCMGLRSASIEPRSCLLPHSEPSIVSFNWQGSDWLPLFKSTASPEKNALLW